MHERSVQDQFDTRADTFDQSARWITDGGLLKAHVEAAQGAPVGRGLELCCGSGVVSGAFRSAGWKMTGLDIALGMARLAGRGMPVVQASSEAIPFRPGSFDLVVLRQAYFLIKDGPRALAEVRRMLKPGGRLVLSQTVAFNDVDEPWLREIHLFKQRDMVRFLGAKDLEADLKQAGFAIERTLTTKVRESINKWMDAAPEQTLERRKKICDMVAQAPEGYRRVRRVEVVNGEVFEDWHWVVFSARAASPRP